MSRIRCIIIVEILNPLPSSYRLCKFCNAKMVSNGEKRNVVGIDPGPSRHRKVEHGDALWSCLHFSFFFFLTLFSPLLGTLLAEHTPAPSSRRFSRGSYQARDPAKAPLILFSKPCSVFSTTLRYISFILILIMNKKKYIFILFLESDLSIIRISQS